MTKIREGNVVYTVDDETKVVTTIEAAESDEKSSDDRLKEIAELAGKPVDKKDDDAEASKEESNDKKEEAEEESKEEDEKEAEAEKKEEPEAEVSESKADRAPVTITVGTRVNVAGKLGKVFSQVEGVYGTVFGVRFDDGLFGEYLDDVIEASVEEEINYATPAEAVVAEFKTYEELPGITSDEVESKTAKARDLNLRAKALVTDSKIPFAAQVELDRIVTATASDVMDLERLSSLMAEEDLPEYPRYQLDSEFKTAETLGVKGGSSWLEDLEVEDPSIRDNHLASTAVSVVSSFTREQLEDEQFMAIARQLQERALDLHDDESRDKFARLLEDARQTELAKTPEKTASVDEEDNIDDFDASHLFM
jgi:hypothetical protein